LVNATWAFLLLNALLKKPLVVDWGREKERERARGQGWVNLGHG